MDLNKQTQQTPWFAREHLTNMFVVALLLLVAALLYSNCEKRYADFVTAQHSLMEKSAADTVQTLEVYIEQTRRMVALFAEAESELIGRLSRQPDNERLETELRRRLEKYIPDYFSYTIADTEGMPLLDDFEGEVGDVCLLDIKNFAEMKHSSELFIHPNTLQYHFDIMSTVNLGGNRNGIFFVSFKPDVLSSLLAHSEIGSHQMLLLHKNNIQLIELTSQGSRDELERDINLSDAELDTVNIEHDVPGSFWTLIYLPDINLFANMKNHYQVQMLEEFAMIFIFSIIMIILIKREERRRYEAEQALLDSHHQLEIKVQERTQELYASNEQLQEEIEERVRAEVELLASERRYALAAKGAHDGIWEWDVVSNQIHFSERWLEIAGDDKLNADTTLGDWLDGIHEDDRELFAFVFESVQQGNTSEIGVEFRMPDKNGLMRWYRCHGAVEKNSEGDVVRIAGSQADIHDHKLAEQQLQHDALHDALTELPNRHLFVDRLSQSVNTRLRDDKYLYAVMFLDLDRFKYVNDSLGHSAGDTLLKGVAARLSACIRPGDTLARFGGDEFVVLVNDFAHVGDVTALADRMIETLAVQFVIEDQELVVNASIGIALGTEDYTDPMHLLRDADIAMYRAKNTGAGKYFIFNESIRETTMNQLETETDLRKAISQNQLQVYYQPIIDLARGEIHGLEALLRWQHPNKGIVQPDDFIPLAEETGLIVPIGAWVMENSCAQIKQWQEKYPSCKELSLSVNLSCKQFLQTDLTEKIKDILHETGIDKTRVALNLEITETVVMQNASCSTDILQDLKSLGISLAVDDFGTGYSSLAYLQRFPIDILKIDKQFVSEIDSSNDSRAIVNTVIELATNLGLNVIAEGVETEEQFKILREMGCRYAQGFYFSKPVPAIEAEKLLAEKPDWS